MFVILRHGQPLPHPTPAGTAIAAGQFALGVIRIDNHLLRCSIAVAADIQVH
jgi:hypothetical protein